VQVSARNGQCAIEVVNTGCGDGEPAPDGSGTGTVRGGRGTGGGRAGGADRAPALQTMTAQRGVALT
jgi:hypothetical protein